MNELESKITIIIPTYNRRKHLKRALTYWGILPFKIIVADGSQHVYKGTIPNNVDYYHDSESDIYERINNALKQVDTPYSALCADDDFHTCNGILAAINFLDKNLDYDSAQGQYLIFSKGKYLTWKKGYQYADGFKIDGVKPVDRVKQATNPYMHQIYSVYRTDVYKKLFKNLGKLPQHNVAEFHFAICSAIIGKHIMLPVLYSVREYSPKSTGSKTEKVIDWIDKNKNTNQLSSWRGLVSVFYSENTGGDIKEGQEIFDVALSQYSIYQRGKRKTSSIKSKTLLVLKRILSTEINRSKKKKTLEDWERIKKVILDYQI